MVSNNSHRYLTGRIRQMREGQIASRELFGGEQHHHDLFVTAIYQWDFNKNARAMECAYIVGYTFAYQNDHILFGALFPGECRQ